MSQATAELCAVMRSPNLASNTAVKTLLPASGSVLKFSAAAGAARARAANRMARFMTSPFAAERWQHWSVRQRAAPSPLRRPTRPRGYSRRPERAAPLTRTVLTAVSHGSCNEPEHSGRHDHGRLGSLLDL